MIIRYLKFPYDYNDFFEISFSLLKMDKSINFLNFTVIFEEFMNEYSLLILYLLDPYSY